MSTFFHFGLLCFSIFLHIVGFFSIIYLYISKVKLATIVESDPKAPLSIATSPRCKGGRYSFPWLLHFTLDPYLIMLSVKQGGIKYHFLSLWYDSTWDWTQVSRAIGEHWLTARPMSGTYIYWVFKKNDIIWDVQGVTEKSISFS